VAKQPRSWWPAEGEIRLSKRHDKVALGGEQVIGPYDKQSCARVVTEPCQSRSQAGAEPGADGPKAREGAKILEMRHRGTRRRMGIGTITQSIVEQERSVSAPASDGSRVAVLECPAAAKPISGGPVKWWSVERRSEEAVVAMIGADNITRRSEGPLVRCATATAKTFGSRSFAGRWGR
jgi:hypothetical protein